MIAYHACRFRALSYLSPAIKGDLSIYTNHSLQSFLRSLAMTSFQLCGTVKSTGLLPSTITNKSILDVFNPKSELEGNQSQDGTSISSMAAGLTHFSTHHMRCWGRDVFISLRGLLLLPGRFELARSHLMAFGSCLRHGLIPNLLDAGIFPRYNARDATWWWLWGIQEYVKLSPEGNKFLKVEVPRRFPPLNCYKRERIQSSSSSSSSSSSKIDTGSKISSKRKPNPALLIMEPNDDGDSYVSSSDERCYKYSSTIGELIQEIMERHARGIEFREWNAGPNLDHAMSDEGFNIKIHVKLSPSLVNQRTGIVYGGNRWNCGTWMDKMGDSAKAGNKGVPATPRDGSAIELVGLLKATTRWLSEGSMKGWFGWDGVMTTGEFFFFLFSLHLYIRYIDVYMYSLNNLYLFVFQMHYKYSFSYSE